PRHRTDVDDLDLITDRPQIFRITLSKLLDVTLELKTPVPAHTVAQVCLGHPAHHFPLGVDREREVPRYTRGSRQVQLLSIRRRHFKLDTIFFDVRYGRIAQRTSWPPISTAGAALAR